MTNQQHGTILIVDDVLENVEVLIRILSREGYAISIAHDGKTALEKVAADKPDLILLDVMMPGGIDGFEVCQILKSDEKTQDIPVIFVTALANTVYIVKGFEVGAVDFITKPFRAKEVLARVTTHLTILRQRREIERLREQDRLYFQKLGEMKDDVMRMTSHDLKNPLNNVKTAVHLLRKHGRIDDPVGQEYLSLLEASADQMLAMIANLLDIARIETGQALNIQEVSLNQFLHDNIFVFSLPARVRKLDLRYEPLEHDVIIMIDPERMEQVLQNLLSNAVKYTPDGGQIILRAEVEPERVMMIVEDTGLGIPADDIPHLFEKFYRVRHESHKQIEGTGLGLSIVKSIVQQHGGEIWVESELGKGSRFCISLPLAHS
ncbi:MAG: hybrid sensor histidine kinase/response regulator [Phototrophicales bacterium]